MVFWSLGSQICLDPFLVQPLPGWTPIMGWAFLRTGFLDCSWSIWFWLDIETFHGLVSVFYIASPLVLAVLSHAFTMQVIAILCSLTEGRTHVLLVQSQTLFKAGLQASSHNNVMPFLIPMAELSELLSSCFFILVGSILLLLAENQTERLSNHGLTGYLCVATQFREEIWGLLDLSAILSQDTST